MGRPKRWILDFTNGIQYVTLSSWKYFHDYLQESLIDSSNYIFRGQKEEEWKIEPTLIRHCREFKGIKFNTILNSHLSNFKYSVRGRANNLKDIIDDEDELWALGQHYGLKTPLLDFTDSPYVAAYFAFYESDSDSKYRIIYGLSQAAVKNHLKDDITFFKPLSGHNQRLISQGGSFIKFKTENDIQTLILNKFKSDESKIKLYVIRIPNNDRNLCLKFLNNMNINHNSLFPDLLGASIYSNTKLEIKNY
ncbi:FRG domain-containing protein [Flavobacterium sp. CYK-4]|uniref:FRG domain-containing protein n=1 Tax=Flavobacterium lotistagni TaxID=2709660 RepID=UPI0014075889|nr:FRG domain-containing protein [Flavobacterium lotistagni]NHM08355.1 FRG domain-containing protein [Flavobacterium lotistagni]